MFSLVACALNLPTLFSSKNVIEFLPLQKLTQNGSTIYVVSW